ncbi:MAG TPA: putative metal-binding motif-containing protein, partial [Myxococcota bacterium]|nr:putative metal-binding motif-containing protein [Myxococcota bacterium]
MRMFSLSFALFLIGCPGPKESDTGPKDLDGDSYTGDVDCDDGNASVNPGAQETCDGVDNDCDEVVDNPDATGATAFYLDEDTDGFGDANASTVACTAPAGYVADSTDCDDGDAAVHPGAEEPDCTDPVDYNCDGSSGSTDSDGDGYAAC